MYTKLYKHLVEPGYKIWRHIPKLHTVKSYENSHRGKANYLSEMLLFFDFFIVTSKTMFPEIPMEPQSVT